MLHLNKFFNCKIPICIVIVIKKKILKQNLGLPQNTLKLAKIRGL